MSEDMVELGRDILDKSILDRDGKRAGKVDDIVLEIPNGERDGELPAPRVVAIVSGPLALSRNLPGPVRWLVRRAYRLLGLDDPRPVEVPWERLRAYDVVAYLDVDRASAGLIQAADAANRRFVERLPWSGEES